MAVVHYLLLILSLSSYALIKGQEVCLTSSDCNEDACMGYLDDSNEGCFCCESTEYDQPLSFDEGNSSITSFDDSNSTVDYLGFENENSTLLTYESWDANDTFVTFMPDADNATIDTFTDVEPTHDYQCVAFATCASDGGQCQQYGQFCDGEVDLTRCNGTCVCCMPVVISAYEYSNDTLPTTMPPVNDTSGSDSGSSMPNSVESTGLGTIETVLLIGGGGFVVLLLVTLYVCYVMRNKKTRRPSQSISSESMYDSQDYVTRTSRSSRSVPIKTSRTSRTSGCSTYNGYHYGNTDVSYNSASSASPADKSSAYNSSASQYDSLSSI